MKKVLITIILLSSLTLVGCKNKGETTLIQVEKVTEITDTYIKFEGNDYNFYFNTSCFSNEEVLDKIISSKIKEESKLKVTYSYDGTMCIDDIKDFVILD